MEKKEFAQGMLIHEQGEPVNQLLLILDGSVSGKYPGGELSLKRGDVIGLSEVYPEYHLMTYLAEEKLTTAVYPYRQGDLMSLLKDQADTVGYFASSLFRQFQDIFSHYKKGKADNIYLYRFFIKNYSRYLEICEQHRISPRTLPGQEELSPFVIEEDIAPWLGGYYKGLYELIAHAEKPTQPGMDFYGGMMLTISRSIHDILAIHTRIEEYRNQILRLFMKEDGMDLFEIFTESYFRIYHLAESEKPDPAFIEEMIHLLHGYGFDEYDFYRQRVDDYRNRLQTAGEHKSGEMLGELSAQKKAALTNSLGVILEYASCTEEESDEFRREISAYKQAVNRNSTEEPDRKRRAVLTRLFYQIYTAALQESLHNKPIPPAVRMFFQFGYMDEELAGLENASYLYDIIEHLPTDPQNRIYTLYEWLLAIYEGRKEPCRNEFDSDYSDYVNELKRNKKITQTEAVSMLSDTKQKVLFELEQVFPVINKVTYGRITTFCPIFSEHNILRPLEKMLVSADRVHQILNMIREKDFQAFCRETIYSMPEKGIVKEYINVEILPDVILAPNIGNRGIMWQEIEGKRRSTPARFMCSLFQMEDLEPLLVRLTGEFRWEMCKRIQGARWNDLTERSLTSEYADYLQSYRKNLDLSGDVKEKIKSDLAKHRNNTKEMFVADYMTWILYESGGSPRLNKVVRQIFFSYCPFTKEIREKLRTNPLYSDVLDKYEIRLKQKIRTMDNLYQKYRNSGIAIPEEVIGTRRLLEL